MHELISTNSLTTDHVLADGSDNTRFHSFVLVFLENFKIKARYLKK